MSHVSTIKIEIKDLESLKKACKTLGLNFVENKVSYKWFGTFVGDHPLPEGFTKEDLGKCDHAIQIEGNKQAYEVGVVARKDGKPGYELLWDFWGGGYGLEEAIGKDGGKLVQNYSIEVATKAALMDGYAVTRYNKPDGRIFLEVTK